MWIRKKNSASFWSLFPTPSLANRFITHKIHSIWMLRWSLWLCVVVSGYPEITPGVECYCSSCSSMHQVINNLTNTLLNEYFHKVPLYFKKTPSMAFQDFENICKVLTTTSLSSWFQAMATRSSPTGSNSATKSSSRWTYYVHVWSWCCSKYTSNW